MTKPLLPGVFHYLTVQTLRVLIHSLLRNVVKKLRREQGDDAAKPRYIVTEPRVGYRMPEGEEPTPEHENTWTEPE